MVDILTLFYCLEYKSKYYFNLILICICTNKRIESIELYTCHYLLYFVTLK